MSMHDAWYLEPQTPPDTWDAIMARRGAETPTQQPDSWALIESRRGAETAPASGGGLTIKPVHFAIGGLLLLALLMFSTGRKKS